MNEKIRETWTETKPFSTSDAAKKLGVAPATVVNWVEQGLLKAGRTPGGHRRLRREDVVEFAEKHGLTYQEAGSPNGSKLLIVDDEEAFANLLEDEIKGQFNELEVLKATNGFEAGRLLAEHKPEIVLLDLRMPGMDGFEVCKRIKENPQNKKVSVIAMTAYGSKEMSARILECGADACLDKPMDMNRLKGFIEESVCMGVH